MCAHVQLSTSSYRINSGHVGCDTTSARAPSFHACYSVIIVTTQQCIILLPTASTPALELTLPPILRVPGVKRPEREDDPSCPPSAKAKTGGATRPLPHASSEC
jgi:hypothetical protein